jgi:hypothetical protein
MCMYCQHILRQEIKLKTNKLFQHKYDLLNDYSSPLDVTFPILHVQSHHPIQMSPPPN